MFYLQPIEGIQWYAKYYKRPSSLEDRNVRFLFDFMPYDYFPERDRNRVMIRDNQLRRAAAICYQEYPTRANLQQLTFDISDMLRAALGVETFQVIGYLHQARGTKRTAHLSLTECNFRFDPNDNPRRPR